jgi:hypothetical protein
MTGTSRSVVANRIADSDAFIDDPLVKQRGPRSSFRGLVVSRVEIGPTGRAAHQDHDGDTDERRHDDDGRHDAF